MKVSFIKHGVSLPLFLGVFGDVVRPSCTLVEGKRCEEGCQKCQVYPFLVAIDKQWGDEDVVYPKYYGEHAEQLPCLEDAVPVVLRYSNTILWVSHVNSQDGNSKDEKPKSEVQGGLRPPLSSK